MESRIFEFISGPENFEIIQQKNGFATVLVEGIFKEDLFDDTEQDLPFDIRKVFVRIVNEDDGVPKTALVPFTTVNNISSAVFENVPCGGPYVTEIIFLDRESCLEYPIRGDKRRHFYVGDVYIIAGQSNAAGMGKGYITEKAECGINILRNLEYWDIASSPFNDIDYAKQSIFSAFAKKIKSETGRPIGLIPAAIGGAALSRWIKSENGDLYDKLMRIIKKHNINACAVLWYQGCADAGEGRGCEEYITRFEEFVKCIRNDLANDSLPVFTFQLNRQMTPDINEDMGRRYDILREAQRQAAKRIKNVYILPAIDAFIMTDFIHGGKASNIMLGERLALQVLDKKYGIGFGADAPEISKATFTGESTLMLEFENVTEFLYTYNAGAENLPIKIEDENGCIPIDSYSVSGNKIKISLKRVVCGDAFASGQCGTSPERVIIDFGTQISMLCFNKFFIEKG